MASEGAASTVLGEDVIMNSGASMTPCMALPFPTPTTGPAYQPPCEQHLSPLVTPSFPSGRPLVLPALPRTPLVAGDADHGPIGTGACNIMDQIRSEGGQPQPPQTQTIVLTQAPISGSAPGALCEGAVCPAPPFLEASAVETIMPTSAFGGTKASEEGGCPGLPPQASPPVAQLACINHPVNTGPRAHGASREDDLATSQSKASPDDSCNPKSVCENLQGWESLKALAQRHLPQSADAEALSCFLVPVLRSLSGLKPTMKEEEGTGWATQEWQRKSNFDRVIHYEMAEKFREFEAEEEMQIQKLQWMKGAQGLPPPAPRRPDSWRPPAPAVGPQPGLIPRKDIPRAQSARTPQWPWETEEPKDIFHEAMKECMDIMAGLVGPAHSATGEPGGQWQEGRKESQQEEDGTYPNPGLLSYTDKLCSQEDFVTKVEEIIHPRFLAQLLSPEVQLDLLVLAEELLELEEGLTPVQLVEKQLLASKEEEGVQAPPNHGGGPAHAEKTPLPGADFGVSGRPAVALGLVPSSQPQKRKCDQSVTGRWRKQHCSQYGAEGVPPC